MKVRMKSASKIAIQIASKYSLKTDLFLPILDKVNLSKIFNIKICKFNQPKTTRIVDQLQETSVYYLQFPKTTLYEVSKHIP